MSWLKVISTKYIDVRRSFIFWYEARWMESYALRERMDVFIMKKTYVHPTIC